MDATVRNPMEDRCYLGIMRHHHQMLSLKKTNPVSPHAAKVLDAEHPPRRCPQKDPRQKQRGNEWGRERYQRSSTMATSHSFRFAASLLAPEASPKVVIAAAADAFWSRLNGAHVSTVRRHPLFLEDPPPFGSFSTQMLQRCHLYYPQCWKNSSKEPSSHICRRPSCGEWC